MGWCEARTVHYKGCAPSGWSKSGSVIQDHSDHGTSKEPINLWTEWIHRIFRCTMIWVILDHWSWSRSPWRNTPFVMFSYSFTYTWIRLQGNYVLVYVVFECVCSELLSVFCSLLLHISLPFNQSKAMSTVLMSDKIKSLTWCGWLLGQIWVR